MADFDHKDLVQSSRVHECKQILDATTSDSGKVITPSDTSNGAGELRNLVLDEVDSTVKTPWTGFEQVTDGTYTSGSPRSISSGVRTQVTIDGTGSLINNSLPEGAAGLWNTSTNVFEPINAFDVYMLRLQFSASTTPADAYVDCELDIGGASGVILRETRPLLRASDGTNVLVFTWPVFTGATFLANGGTIYVTPSENTDLWDFGLMTTKLHNGGA